MSGLLFVPLAGDILEVGACLPICHLPRLGTRNAC